MKESVKVSKDLLTQIKERKKATGITITAFIEQAITDKLTKTNCGITA
jgi:predicted DNA binding CopG/RHH family protein